MLILLAHKTSYPIATPNAWSTYMYDLVVQHFIVIVKRTCLLFLASFQSKINLSYPGYFFLRVSFHSKILENSCTKPEFSYSFITLHQCCKIITIITTFNYSPDKLPIFSTFYLYFLQIPAKQAIWKKMLCLLQKGYLQKTGLDQIFVHLCYHFPH